MAFQVQDNALRSRGPYHFVRNPIYLADLIAMCGFAICLPAIGTLLPVLFYLHYHQLIRYEETSLEVGFASAYREYASCVPRFIPKIKSIVFLPKYFEEFKINYDGFRYNALYVLFIPGFAVAIFTGQFFHAVIIGLPAVLDWAVNHTKKGLQKSGNETYRGTKRISSKSKIFEDVLYAQCWEDPQIDREALKIQSSDVVFSITSGGCNTLSFLLDNPRKVIALDISRYQNYVLKLKIAAFELLTYDELLEFLGVRSSSHRPEYYLRVRTSLDLESRTYWDSQTEKIQSGLIHCGRYEQYMRLLRVWLHRSVGLKTIREFFKTENSNDRAKLFHRKWENIGWWILTRILLSRAAMTMVFDKAFFKYLDRSFSFGKHFASKAKHALTELPMKENYFLAYILLGNYYDENYLPLYLRRENYETIRNRVGRIQVITDSCEHFFSVLPDCCISKFNFTNIFEWMSPWTFTDLLNQTIRVARDGAVITYRNLIVFREHPASLANRISSYREFARSLHERDLSFIYSNYVVEEIHKEEEQWSIESKELSIVAQ